MQTATLQKVRENLPELLQQLGVGQELIIFNGGTPIGRLLPPPMPMGKPVPGRGRGKLIINADDDEHLKDFAEYMP